MSDRRLAQLLFPAVMRQVLSPTAQAQAALSRPDGETRPADPIRTALVMMGDPLALKLEAEDAPRSPTRLSHPSGSFSPLTAGATDRSGDHQPGP